MNRENETKEAGPNRAVPENQKGFTMILIVMMLTLLSLTPVIVQMAKISNQDAYLQEKMTVQADNTARAGLMDAISWFQRQGVQPVSKRTYTYADAAFRPRYNSNPAVSDTKTQDDEDNIGIVNVYDLDASRKLKARYEVRRQKDPATNPIDPSAVRDITPRMIEGGLVGEGRVWYIESAGYVYREVDASKKFDEDPNVIVGRSRAGTDIWILTMNPPARAGLIVNNLNTVTLNHSNVRGEGKAGIAHYGGTAATLTDGAVITGTPPTSVIAGTAIDPNQVFGVSPQALKLLADISVNNPADLPSAGFPAMSVVYIGNSITFDDGLDASGILYVDGDLTFNVTNDAQGVEYQGLVYVNGNLTITATAFNRVSFAGSVIVTGSVTITANASAGFPRIVYDEAMVDAVQSQVAHYRQSKATYYVFSGAK